MAGRESGLGAGLYINQFDVTEDYNSVDVLSKSLATIDQTGLRTTGPTRKAGRLGGELTGKVFLNQDAGRAHELFSTLSRSSRQASYFHRETLGAPVASLIGRQMNYDTKRAQDGDLKLDVQLLSTDWWLDWGLALTAGMRTDTGATNGAAVDFGSWGAPASFGAQGYLHVKAFTGTSATITIQRDDNSGFTTPTTLLTFTVVSAATFEQVLTTRTATVERYLRVITTGTFSSLQFAVAATVNTTDMTLT